MEHLHTLPTPWALEDDFQRVQTWLAAGIDDVLDVSVPWSVHEEVSITDLHHRADNGVGGVYERIYQTPAGELRHAVKETGENISEGWVVQPDYVPLFEDFNIPRAAVHAISDPEDVEKIPYLYRSPGAAERDWLRKRMDRVGAFAGQAGVAVQAWSAFGMDAVVWLMGPENAVLFALDYPAEFSKLLDIITETDLARTELALEIGGADIIVERGWYSATDFWSPEMFDRFLFDRIRTIAAVVHRKGKYFGYVMTTGISELGERLADAGVDLLYFYDPVQDFVELETVRRLAEDGLTIAGGTNALSLLPSNWSRLEEEVTLSCDVLGSTNRFILHPVDALFPDTPWEGVRRLIELWKKHR
jgi:hypothetical protein